MKPPAPYYVCAWEIDDYPDSPTIRSTHETLEAARRDCEEMNARDGIDLGRYWVEDMFGDIRCEDIFREEWRKKQEQKSVN